MARRGKDLSMAQRGIQHVLEHERLNGRDPVDVSQRKGKKAFIGFDIISVDREGDDHRTIEVKSAKSNIPDAHENEFTRTLTFVSTHLYLVQFMDDEKTVRSLHVIPKHVIDLYSQKHRLVRHIVFASALKTRLKGGEFVVSN